MDNAQEFIQAGLGQREFSGKELLLVVEHFEVAGVAVVEPELGQLHVRLQRLRLPGLGGELLCEVW